MSKESVLIVVAHPDDEILGCGGSIAWHASRGDDVVVLILADGVGSRQYLERQNKISTELEERRLNAEVANKILGVKKLILLSYPDNEMDTVPLLKVVQEIERVIASYKPTIIYTHNSSDVNIDHRCVHDAVISASRPQPGGFIKQLLFFEIPSSTEWRPSVSRVMFAPNWYIDISGTLVKKIEALSIYSSEVRDFPHPRSLEAIEHLARWRGASIGVGAAEAFELGRLIQ